MSTAINMSVIDELLSLSDDGDASLLVWARKDQTT